jgi:hypothetical protein
MSTEIRDNDIGASTKGTAKVPEKPSPKRPHGAPSRNKNAKKHGHYALEVSLKRGGFGVLPRLQRETVAEWRANIEEDAGGRDRLSQLKQLQVERYLVTEVLLQSIDGWLLKQPSLINKRKRSLYPVLEQRSRLAQLSVQLASAIGIERVPRPAESLEQTYYSQDGNTTEEVGA